METMTDRIAEAIRLHTTDAKWTPEGLAEVVAAAVLEYEAEQREAAKRVVELLWPEPGTTTLIAQPHWSDLLIRDYFSAT